MVSFIVIGRNEGWRLEKCFKGIYSFVEAEKINEYEVIYVDSRSTDNSIELSNSFGNTKTILISGECNAAIARNIGAKEATGDIFFFIDGDMELLPGFWSSIVKNGQMEYPFLSGVVMDVLHDQDWNYIETRIRNIVPEGKDKIEVKTGGLFLIESNLWWRVGGMDNKQKRCQDMDLGFRLTKLGYRLHRKSSIWVNHYTRDYQERSDSNTFVRYQALLMRKHLLNFPAQKFLFGPNYTIWGLFISCIFMLVFRSFIPFLLYLLMVGYRAFRECKRNQRRIKYISIFFRQIWMDFVFVFYFITYWPSDIQTEYEIK